MNGNRVVKASVGKIAAITVDLIRQGVAVHCVGDAYPAEELSPHEKSLWFVSAPLDSPLADKVMAIPPASSEGEAWELAIQFFRASHEIAEDLRAGVKTHRRTLRKVWQDMRVHAAYAIECEAYASEHYGDPFPVWARAICWLDGAATGFFDDDCWMPITWRLMGRTPAEWHASFGKATQSDVPPAIGYAKASTAR